MRLVFAGTPEVAVPALDALLASGHDVLAVVTRPDARAGRGRREVASPVAVRATEAGIETLKPAKASDPALHDRLAELAPDCCPVVAYGALVPRSLLDLPRHGWVNLHFSLLPAWRGAAPVQHAILHGDEVTGATTFVLEAGMDTGPVLGVVTEEIGAYDTAGDLLDRLARSGAKLLVASLDGIESGEIQAVPQPNDGVSYAPKLDPADVRVDWTAPAIRVDRLVRAATPSPGAWTMFGDLRVKLGPVRLTDREPIQPGELQADRDGVVAGTGTRPVLLGDVQMEGKRRMSAAEWARGVHLPARAAFA